MNLKTTLLLLCLAFLFTSPWWLPNMSTVPQEMDESLIGTTEVARKEIVFWHFWGGKDRDVVEDVARRFNQSQEDFFVRPVAMPGNNLQAKIFLAVAGGDPPDLVNQDDPILADWAERGILEPMDRLVNPEEVEAVRKWMFPSAQRLSVYDNRVFAICNGLDIRALYYNKTSLDRYGLSPPTTIQQLNQIAATISPPTRKLQDRYAFLPDSRRLWAWGYVFGGKFLDETGNVCTDAPEIVRALDWMKSFGEQYGPDNISAFRKGDQSLPGKTFPLLPVKDNELVGRYSLIMDGQWRVRDIQQFLERRREQRLAVPEFGVIPLPTVPGGRERAGWVNGNFFVIPKGAKNATGSWEFIKFWIGFTRTAEAVKTNVQGGWIPVSKTVVDHPDFQEYLHSQPLFRGFVELADSPNQYPIPQVPGAGYFRRRIETAGYDAMSRPDLSTHEILTNAQQEIEQVLSRKQWELGMATERGNRASEHRNGEAQ